MSSKPGGTKKPSLMMRLFSTERKSSLISPAADDDTGQGTQPSAADEKLLQRRQRLQRLHSMDAATFHDRSAGVDGVEARPARHPNSPQSPRSHPPASPKSAGRRPHSAKSRHGSSTSSSTSTSSRHPSLTPSEPRSPVTPDSAKSLPPSSPLPLQSPTKAPGHDKDAHPPHRHHTKKHTKHLPTSKSLPAESASPQSPHPVATASPSRTGTTHPLKSSISVPGAASGGGKKLKNRKKVKKSGTSTTKIDTSRPLEFPTTPELIIDYHRQKPFLNSNEEWLVVELNEYECLVDSLEILRIIAKHSKFFEVEPDQLWEEFFEFVENVPSYDEIINFDVWQEFRFVKYAC